MFSRRRRAYSGIVTLLQARLRRLNIRIRPLYIDHPIWARIDIDLGMGVPQNPRSLVVKLREA